MLTSIGKFSKSFFVNSCWDNYSSICFLGHGGCFRGGNQNVIATVDSEKISTQEFVEYLED